MEPLMEREGHGRTRAPYYDAPVDGQALTEAAVAAAVEAARGGDLGAFNTLVRHYQRRVYNLCYRTTGSPEDAADATQEAFLHAYRGIGTFHGPADGFLPWLLRVATNACLDQLRRRKRRPASSLEALDEDEGLRFDARDALADPAPGPEGQALGNETARRIQDGLQRLSDEQRMTVVLCDVQGHSYEEVAAMMGVELGTVKSRLSRARASLRDYLAANGELPAMVRRLEQ
jgi:RNA polymerase sigma-70 factor (ECF subfamily)